MGISCVEKLNHWGVNTHADSTSLQHDLLIFKGDRRDRQEGRFQISNVSIGKGKEKKNIVNAHFIFFLLQNMASIRVELKFENCGFNPTRSFQVTTR